MRRINPSADAIYNKIINTLNEWVSLGDPHKNTVCCDMSTADVMEEYVADNSGVEADTFGWQDEISKVSDFDEIRLKHIDGDWYANPTDITKRRFQIESDITNEVVKRILLDTLEDIEDNPERYLPDVIDTLYID